MMRRNLIVAFMPNKTNSVALSELNHRIMMLNVCYLFYLFFHSYNFNKIIKKNDFQDNKNSCLNLTNNHVDFYCSWLPNGGPKIRDTEIGINASVAELIGKSKNKFKNQKFQMEI